jgi:AraC-like DNA-binding protein
MKTKIIYPDPRMSHLVRYFWTIEADNAVQMQSGVRTFVDDSTGIIVQHQQGKSALTKDERRLPLSFIYGQTTLPTFTTMDGPFTAVGVLLHPHAISSIFRLDAHYLTDRIYSLEQFENERELAERIVNEGEGSQRIATLTEYIQRKTMHEIHEDELVKGAIHMVRCNKLKEVRDIIQYFKISERQLERRFSSAVGVSPRHYLQTHRFNQALQMMRTHRGTKLIDIAYDLGFSDQSHFSRVIKKYSGLKPRELQKKAARELVNVVLET